MEPCCILLRRFLRRQWHDVDEAVDQAHKPQLPMTNNKSSVSMNPSPLNFASVPRMP